MFEFGRTSVCQTRLRSASADHGTLCRRSADPRLVRSAPKSVRQQAVRVAAGARRGSERVGAALALGRRAITARSCLASAARRASRLAPRARGLDAIVRTGDGHGPLAIGSPVFAAVASRRRYDTFRDVGQHHEPSHNRQPRRALLGRLRGPRRDLIGQGRAALPNHGSCTCAPSANASLSCSFSSAQRDRCSGLPAPLAGPLGTSCIRSGPGLKATGAYHVGDQVSSTRPNTAAGCLRPPASVHPGRQHAPAPEPSSARVAQRVFGDRRRSGACLDSAPSVEQRRPVIDQAQAVTTNLLRSRAECTEHMFDIGALHRRCRASNLPLWITGPARRTTPTLSASTRVYRVLGGRQPTPCAGTRDDGATGTDACRTPGNTQRSGMCPDLNPNYWRAPSWRA